MCLRFRIGLLESWRPRYTGLLLLLLLLSYYY